MNENLMEVICIIDESGSMAPLTSDTIGGFNSYLDSLKKLSKKVNLTLVTFSNKAKTIYNGVDVGTILRMDEYNYRPSGGTALFDAIGFTVKEVGERLARTNEGDRPSKVTVFIATDGEENESRNYKIEQIKQIIKDQTEKYSWDFVFAGANIDAFAAGSGMGVSMQNTSGYTADGIGTKSLYLAASMRADELSRGVVLSNFSENLASVDSSFRKDAVDLTASVPKARGKKVKVDNVSP